MKPPARVGAWVGAVLTAGLIGVGYLGWKLFGLPFAPFDLFDFTARALPGAFVTFAIDSMVRVSQTLQLASTGSAAKLAEQTLAVGLMLAGGTAVAAMAFAALALSNESALLFGGVLGSMFGAIALIVANQLDRIAPGDQFISGSWLVSGFLLWGLALGWANDRLRAPSAGATVDARRQFLIRFSRGVAALTVVSTIGGAIAGAFRKTVAGIRWSDANALPNASASVKALPGTRAEFTALVDHYRIDADTRPPAIDARRWQLRIGGPVELIEQPLTFTLDDLRAFEPMHQFVTLSCISNPIGGDLISTTRWTGVSAQRLVARARPGPRATHVKITSADGFWEVVALDAIRRDERIMLAYEWDGVPLPLDHGFPLRLYAPNLYGMKQPKWITTIDAIDHWEAGYWVSRGWDREGQMHATSVVDVVSVSAASAAGRAILTAGGIAHAGARGVSKVEVRVDDGEWREASLRDPLSGTTWVVWRIESPVTNSSHVVSVRCYDGDGTLQQDEPHARRVQRT